MPKGTHIFNGDLVYAELLQKYPDYYPEKLKGGVPSRLETERDEAIAQRRDFAFESNYSNDLAIEITERSKTPDTIPTLSISGWMMWRQPQYVWIPVLH